MINLYLKMAVRSLRSARWRSFLTMLGVVVGVSSVVTIISIGDGVKYQITKQVNDASSNLITIRPGRLVERDQHGQVTKVHYQSVFSSGSLTDADIATIKKNKEVSAVVPYGLFSGLPQARDTKYSEALLIGTSPDMPNITNRKIAYGSFFSSNDANGAVAVIGQRVAEQLFHENSPIGKTFILRGEEIIVRGVLETAHPSPQDLGLNYDNAIFMPYDYAKKLAGGQLQVYQVLTSPGKDQAVATVVTILNNSLKTAHGGGDDFTVLQTADTLAIASNALNLMTALVATMAGISLLVGGIGIMNIMFVAVSERTHEIGVRKSVGATNSQIRGQFLTEAVLLSAIGGIVGVLVSLLANYFLRLFTSLEPAINPELMAIAVLGAIFLGSIFGIAPAIKASQKDPIEALRRIT